jgi:hypothetical protein
MRWVVVATTLAVVIVTIAQPFVISAFYRSVFTRGDELAMPWLLTLLLILVVIMWGCWRCDRMLWRGLRRALTMSWAAPPSTR